MWNVMSLWFLWEWHCFPYPRLSLTVPDLSLDCQCKICFSLYKTSWGVHASGPGTECNSDARFQAAPCKDLSIFLNVSSLLFENHSSKETRISHFPSSLSCARVWPRSSLCPVLPVPFALHVTKESLVLICSAFSQKSLAHCLLQLYWCYPNILSLWRQPNWAGKVQKACRDLVRMSLEHTPALLTGLANGPL